MFNKGDIILPIVRVARQDQLKGLFHPAIVWELNYNGNDDFLGVMLTSSNPSTVFDNIPMSANHFQSDRAITYNNSHFVNQLFHKFGIWGEFEKVGELTKEGVNNIISCLSNCDPLPFTEYLESLENHRSNS